MTKRKNKNQDKGRGDLMLMGRMLAGMDVLKYSGVNSLEIAYDDDRSDDQVPVVWWAEGNWGGQRVFSQMFPYPAHAVEDLLSRVLNGGRCRRCGQTTVVGVDADGFCCFRLACTDLDEPSTWRYVRSCEGRTR